MLTVEPEPYEGAMTRYRKAFVTIILPDASHFAMLQASTPNSR